jgi:hypothetical protein
LEEHLHDVLQARQEQHTHDQLLPVGRQHEGRERADACTTGSQVPASIEEIVRQSKERGIAEGKYSAICLGSSIEGNEGK